MANDRGLLPKASREDLSAHLTRQLDRWYQNAYQDDNLFLTMARRPELLDQPCLEGVGGPDVGRRAADRRGRVLRRDRDRSLTCNSGLASARCPCGRPTWPPVRSGPVGCAGRATRSRA